MDGASLVSPTDGSNIVCGKLCPVRFVGDGDWTGVSEISCVGVEILISPSMTLSSCGSLRPRPSPPVGSLVRLRALSFMSSFSLAPILSDSPPEARALKCNASLFMTNVRRE